jgi:CHAT domain-containing protein/Tfp pilus assembly protein PilF
MLIGEQLGAYRSRRIVRPYRRSARLWQSLIGQTDSASRLPSGDGGCGYEIFWRRDCPWPNRQGEWEQWSLNRRIIVGLSFLLLACVSSCRNDNPQADFDRINKALLHGNLKQARDEAHRECQWFRSSREWAWKFRTLEARAEIHQGLYEDALNLLKSEPLPSDQPDLSIPILTIIGEANALTHNFSEAERSLNEATKFCTASASTSCGYVLRERGVLAGERNQSLAADRLFAESLAFARSRGDALLTSYALLSLGYRSLAEGRFDESIDRSEAGYQAAKAIGAQRIELVTQSNLGWAYYKLGDSEKALQLSEEAEELASRLGVVSDQENLLTNIGYIYMDEREFDLAAQSFQQALGLARRINAKEDIYNALRVMARLSLQTGDLADASHDAQQALDLARQDGNHLDELYPTLVQGQIAARRGDTNAAEGAFLQVERDKICPVFLKWEAERSLARLYEDESQFDSAEKEYRTALTTFETARSELQHVDSRLPFLSNASRIYDGYLHLLVTRNKTAEALQVADFNRARTLKEGLGMLPKATSFAPEPLNAQQIARHAGGTILFYWLGEEQSYLWAITPRKVGLFQLPPAAEIKTRVERYRKAIIEQRESTPTASDDGAALYRILVEPAKDLLPKDISSKDTESGKVFIVPDGILNSLNFETLLVSRSPGETKKGEIKREPKQHYWIEDVTLSSAGSLRILQASNAAHRKGAGNLLLFGDAIAASEDFPQLPKAAIEMESIKKHFRPAEQQVFARDQANPTAYLASKPERFSYIHFVAHGTASRLSPLDSAIVLSRALSKDSVGEGADEDSFKLYARDIIRYPLRAELVTISTCRSAGERAYSGEGLVGLSWAFVRAGAHHVIGALWDVSDTSTPQLMDELYGGLKKGEPPDAALRNAKLTLLRSGASFRKPFFWAPFQLYTGS